MFSVCIDNFVYFSLCCDKTKHEIGIDKLYDERLKKWRNYHDVNDDHDGENNDQDSSDKYDINHPTVN